MSIWSDMQDRSSGEKVRRDRNKEKRDGEFVLDREERKQFRKRELNNHK